MYSTTLTYGMRTGAAISSAHLHNREDNNQFFLNRTYNSENPVIHTLRQTLSIATTCLHF
jgi:hypothetical protein